MEGCICSIRAPKTRKVGQALTPVRHGKGVPFLPVVGANLPPSRPTLPPPDATYPCVPSGRGTTDDVPNPLVNNDRTRLNRASNISRVISL